MFAGVSGLRSHQVMMDVVGNNIANVNTVGYKSSTVLFQDTLSQLVRGASGGTGEATAGVNPQQVGLGVRVGATDMVFSQGASQLTGRATDVAIQGDGFFVMRMGTETLYTRAGSFGFDQNGFLTDPSGAVVQGWMGTVDGTISTNSPVGDIRLPVGQVISPVATTKVTVGGNLSTTALPTDPAISTAIQVIDSLGTPQRITVNFLKTGDNAWEMEVFGPDGQTQIGSPIPLSFDPATGELSSPTTLPSFSFQPPGGADTLAFEIDFGAVGVPNSLTQFGGTSTAAAIGQDGTTTGYLRSFAISDDGVVSGVFSNGRSQPLARIAMGAFNNPGGLVKAGQSLYRASGASGQALVGTPGTAGRGSMAAGTLEMSNVDLAQEFTSLIIAQRGFQANSRIITASDEMLQDLVNLKR
jgi:flagellar hook protein FlgE